MRSAFTLAVAVLACAAACAQPNLDEPEPFDVGDAPTTRGSGAAAPSGSTAPSGSGAVPLPEPGPSGAAVPPSPVDAGPPTTRWQGMLPATLPVSFGGGQYCSYRITLQRVKIDISADATGKVAAATVTANAVEEVLNAPCGNPAIPAHTQKYSLVKAAVLPSGITHLELAPSPANHPAASLVIEGDLRSAGPELTLQWHRTDYGPPIDWRIKALITVTSS